MKKPIDIKLTQEGYDNLLAEQAHLIERRPGVLKRMVDAREQGDLSENAGYHAAKEELGRIDSRLKVLKIMLRFAEVVEAKGKDSVSFGSTVTVESDGVKKDFIIVSALEADPMGGKMSDISPIGSALIGKKVGDSVEVETPGGKVSYKIHSIS